MVPVFGEGKPVVEASVGMINSPVVSSSPLVLPSASVVESSDSLVSDSVSGGVVDSSDCDVSSSVVDT